MDKKTLIEQSIQKHLANGGKLIRKGWGLTTEGVPGQNLYRWISTTKDNSCCGLSCVFIGETYPLEEYSDLRNEVDKRFGSTWVMWFIDGFDGNWRPQTETARDVYDFGAEMWRKYGWNAS